MSEAPKADRSDQLELHGEIVGQLMAVLLAGGLRRPDVSSSDLYPAFTSDFDSLDDFDAAFVDVAVWLRDEGYIRYHSLYSGSENETCIAQAAITDRCLAALGEPIPALGGRTGKEVIRAGASGDLEASAYVKAGGLLGGVLGGFVATAPG